MVKRFVNVLDSPVEATQRAKFIVSDFYKCNTSLLYEGLGNFLSAVITQAGRMQFGSVNVQHNSAHGFFNGGDIVLRFYPEDDFVAIECYDENNPKQVVGVIKSLLDPVYFDMMNINRGITNMEALHGAYSEAGPEQLEGAVVQEGSSCSAEGTAGKPDSSGSGGV